MAKAVKETKSEGESVVQKFVASSMTILGSATFYLLLLIFAVLLIIVTLYIFTFDVELSRIYEILIGALCSSFLVTLAISIFNTFIGAEKTGKSIETHVSNALTKSMNAFVFNDSTLSFYTDDQKYNIIKKLYNSTNGCDPSSLMPYSDTVQKRDSLKYTFKLKALANGFDQAIFPPDKYWELGEEFECKENYHSKIFPHNKGTIRFYTGKKSLSNELLNNQHNLLFAEYFILLDKELEKLVDLNSKEKWKEFVQKQMSLKITISYNYSESVTPKNTLTSTIDEVVISNKGIKVDISFPDDLNLKEGETITMKITFAMPVAIDNFMDLAAIIKCPTKNVAITFLHPADVKISAYPCISTFKRVNNIRQTYEKTYYSMRSEDDDWVPAGKRGYIHY